MIATSELGPETQHPGTARLVRMGATVLALVAMLGAGLFAYIAISEESEPASVPAIIRDTDGAVLIPSRAVDGVLSIVIPLGTAEQMAAGLDGYRLPSVINMHVGDRIVITNEDVFPHIMLFAFVMPGETTERVFTQPLSETYSAGCTIDPTPNGFTSLFVK